MNSIKAKSRFSWPMLILIFFVVGLFALVFSVFIQTNSNTAWFSFGGANASTTAERSIVTGVGGSFEKPDQPVRLIIPSIGVDANIQKVGLAWQGNGQMGIPTNFTDVAWYKDGTLPGMPGSAVIDGHLDGKDVAEAVFYDLDKLQKGDIVEVVDASGRKLKFIVVETKSYDRNADTTEIFSGDASSSRLNLITCSGDWIANEKSYNDRIVVFTELVTN